MPDQKLTDVPYIGEQTEQELRQRIRGGRATSRAGEEVTTREASKFNSVAQLVLDTRQQQKLSETSKAGFKPDRKTRQKQAQKAAKQRSQREQSDTIRRGDFSVSRDEFADARDRFEELPDEEQSEDRGGREPVTTNYDQWSSNIDKFDYPGVDTPQQRRVRQQTVDNLFTPIGAKRRAREAWRDSKPERTDAQERLGEVPEGFNAKRTGVLRDASDGQFVERPVKKTENGLVSANGRRVGATFRDPTIGRNPDSGEFVDRPLDNEPTITAPDFIKRRSVGDTEISDPFDMSDGGGALDSSPSFDRQVTVGVTPDTLGDGFRVQTDDDIADRTLGKGTALVEQARQTVGLPDASSADSTDVVAEVDIGLQDRESGFGYDTEILETRESNDTIFNFR